MAYIALYRRWRPKNFSDLVGQDHVSRTLSQAIKTGKIAHAYLFAGPRGTGKTSTAKIFAKALNCEKGPTDDPCGVCERCRRISDGTSMDVFEIDAASNRGIDEIRELRETVKFSPVDARYKVYIIDEVHMLTSEAFNALLKTIEEPPGRVVFILATTEAHKVPATIQSRCQRYDFRRISAREIVARMRFIAEQSGIDAEDAALETIARAAEGGMRDALSTLDQCASLADEKITAKLAREILGLVGRDAILGILRAISAHDAKDALTKLEEIIAEGKDLRQIVTETIATLRELMIAKALGSPLGDDLTVDEKKAVMEDAALFSPDAYPLMIKRFHEALTELRWTPETRIAVEAALLTLCRPASGVTITSGVSDDARIAALEERVRHLQSGVGTAASTYSDDTRRQSVGGMTSRGTAAPMYSDDERPRTRPGEKSEKTSPGLSGSPAAPPPTAQKIREKTAADKSRPSAGGSSAPPAPLTSVKKPAQGARGTLADGAALWQKLLSSLSSDRPNKVIHACLSKGSFGGIEDGSFIVRFDSGFLKMRLERDDYRAVVERHLAKISGKGLRLLVTATEKPRVLPPTPPDEEETAEKVVVDMDSMPPQERRVLQTAVEVFGDNFVPMEDDDMPPFPEDEDDSSDMPPDDESFDALLKK